MKDGKTRRAMEAKDRTMHARLTVNGREVLRASDTQPVGEGGTVVMPLDDMFRGARRG